jgi:fermentation-respiration switch protein FrsA (DUF1100 family)
MSRSSPPPPPSQRVAPAAPSVPRSLQRARRVVVALLAIAGLLTFAYAGVSWLVASRLAYGTPSPLTRTPATLGLQYRDVIVPSRTDHLPLKGWFIPGVLPDGQLTADRAIIVVHGFGENRDDPQGPTLNLSAQLARHGFTVLSFDLQGQGQSPPAALSMGLNEQRDVLGAVDFLRGGPLPYPELGRPRAIAGWGVSLGAASLVFAAAQEPAIQALVMDAMFSDAIPILEREIPMQSGLPAFFTPGVLRTAQVLYGIDYYSARPIDVVARLAPRPMFFIHGSADERTPSSMMADLVAAAEQAPNAHVQSWLVPGARHAQAFNTATTEYVTRLVAFYTAALGPDQSGR